MAETYGKARLLETLTQAQESRAAVAVYSNADDFQSYEVAFVESATSMETVLRCLTPRGEADGLRILRTDDIVRVDAGTAYARKIELLHQFAESVFQQPDGPIDASNGMLGLLESAREYGWVVHLVDGADFGPTGYVRHIGDDFVEIERIGPNGEPDGTATVLLNCVANVHIGRRQEQVVGFLNRYHHGLRKLLEP